MLQFVGLQMEQTCRLFHHSSTTCDRISTRCEQGSDRRTKSYKKAPIISGQHFLLLLSDLPSALRGGSKEWNDSSVRPFVCVTLVALFFSCLSSRRLHNHCHHNVIAVVIFVIADDSDSNHVSQSRPRHIHV
jgi:hypothetical protein